MTYRSIPFLRCAEGLWKPRTGLVLVPFLLLTACAAQSEPTWSKPNSTERDVKVAKYWCSKVRYEQPMRFNPSGTDKVKKITTLNEDCMRKRGFVKVMPKS